MFMVLAILTDCNCDCNCQSKPRERKTNHTCFRFTVTSFSTHSVLHKSSLISCSRYHFSMFWWKLICEPRGIIICLRPIPSGPLPVRRPISSSHLRLAHPSQSYLSPLCQPIHVLPNAARQQEMRDIYQWLIDNVFLCTPLSVSL